MEINKTVKLKDAVLIGEFTDLWLDTLPELKDVYIIEKSAIDNITDLLQGAKLIKTKPKY